MKQQIEFGSFQSELPFGSSRRISTPAPTVSSTPTVDAAWGCERGYSRRRPNRSQGFNCSAPTCVGCCKDAERIAVCPAWNLHGHGRAQRYRACERTVAIHRHLWRAAIAIARCAPAPAAAAKATGVRAAQCCPSSSFSPLPPLLPLTTFAHNTHTHVLVNNDASC